MRLLCCILVLSMFGSCDAKSTPAEMERMPLMWRDTFPAEVIDYRLPYDLSKPDDTFKMPDELDEISGLDISADGKRLIAVQDEDGYVYYISTKSGKIKEEIKFHKDGDYEGIEFVGDHIFVLKSSGTLYEIINPEVDDEDDLKVEKYNDYLDNSHNVEGLAYDSVGNRLLLACKGNDKDDYKLEKYIYAFDLTTYEVDTIPAFSISQDAIMTYLGMSETIKKLEKFSNKIDPSTSYFSFSPSAVAIHPTTGNIYVTSSVGKLLVVLNPIGQLVHIEKLDPEVHRQPEGLAFANDGTLYIANEGKSGAGRIRVFKMIKD